MTTTSSPVRLLSVVVDGNRHDVAVPATLTLAELVAQAGRRPDDPLLRVSTLGGGPLELRAAVGELLADGATVLITAAGPPPRPSTARGSADRGRPAPLAAGELALSGAGLLAVVLIGLLARFEGLTMATRLIVAGAALVAGVAAAIGRVRPEFGQPAAALFGFGAGFALVPAGFAGQLELAVTVGSLTAAVVLAFARSGRTDGEAVVASVLLLAAVGTALAFGIGLTLGGSPRVPAAILLGLLPGVLRVLPSYSLDVPDEQLIDVNRLAVTAWTARTSRTPARRIRLAELRREVADAQRTVSAAAVTVSALAVLLAGLVLARPGSPTARWGSIALVSLVLLALALQPRSARSLVNKVAPRLAAALLLGELAIELAGRHSPAGSLLGAAGLLLAGLLGCAAASAVATGWTSLRLSRSADLLESLAVLLALPAALIAVDAISTFRQLTSR